MMQPYRFGIRPGGAQGDIQRQEVLLGRVLIRGVRGKASVIHQRGDVMGGKMGVNPVREFGDIPGFRLVERDAAAKAPQVMGEAATAQDKHALCSQWGERLAERVMILWPQPGFAPRAAEPGYRP